MGGLLQPLMYKDIGQSSLRCRALDALYVMFAPSNLRLLLFFPFFNLCDGNSCEVGLLSGLFQQLAEEVLEGLLIRAVKGEVHSRRLNRTEFDSKYFVLLWLKAALLDLHQRQGKIIAIRAFFPYPD